MGRDKTFRANTCECKIDTHCTFLKYVTSLPDFVRVLNSSVDFVQIRHASLERLLERLLDIRFLSVDFLNTFLITYRVFTTAAALLDTLLQFYYSNNAKDSLYVDLFSPVSRKVRSVSLPTESLSPQPDKTKGE